ncbi:MAG TPA: hypothetical protein VLV81_14705 [Acidimicrobiia bacterium]|nr:hypothetical protein [Acidimicrobiia bacterium]
MRCRGAATAIGVLAIVIWPSAALGAPRGSASTAGILKAGLISSRDVPAGWTSTPGHKNPALLIIDGLGPCAATQATLNSANQGARRAFSRRFVAPDQIGAAQDVVFLGRDLGSAQAYASAYDGPEGRACVQAVADQVAHQASGTAVVTPIADTATVGDQGVGYEFQITAPNNGALVTLVSDLIVVRVGRAVCGFQLQDVTQSLPARVGIVRAVTARLRRLAAH